MGEDTDSNTLSDALREPVVEDRGEGGAYLPLGGDKGVQADTGAVGECSRREPAEGGEESRRGLSIRERVEAAKLAVRRYEEDVSKLSCWEIIARYPLNSPYSVLNESRLSRKWREREIRRKAGNRRKNAVPRDPKTGKRGGRVHPNTKRATRRRIKRNEYHVSRRDSIGSYGVLRRRAFDVISRGVFDLTRDAWELTMDEWRALSERTSLKGLRKNDRKWEHLVEVEPGNPGVPVLWYPKWRLMRRDRSKGWNLDNCYILGKTKPNDRRSKWHVVSDGRWVKNEIEWKEANGIEWRVNPEQTLYKNKEKGYRRYWESRRKILGDLRRRERIEKKNQGDTFVVPHAAQ